MGDVAVLILAVDWTAIALAVAAIVVPFLIGVLQLWLSGTRWWRRARSRAESPPDDRPVAVEPPAPAEVDASAAVLEAAYRRLRVLYDGEVAESDRLRADRDERVGELHGCRNELVRLQGLLLEHGIHDPGPG